MRLLLTHAHCELRALSLGRFIDHSSFSLHLSILHRYWHHLVLAITLADDPSATLAASPRPVRHPQQSQHRLALASTKPPLLNLHRIAFPIVYHGTCHPHHHWHHHGGGCHRLRIQEGELAFTRPSSRPLSNLRSHSDDQFVYDPHLAPIIDNFIEQHRIQRGRRYEQIPVAVAADRSFRRDDRGGAEAGARLSGSRGRSTAVEPKAGPARKRRPAEFYELDESRVLPNEAVHDKGKDRDMGMAEVSGHRAVSYQPRAHRRKPVPRLPDEAAVAPNTSAPSPLIFLDKDDNQPSRPPSQEPVPPLYMENPFTDAVRARARTPSAAAVLFPTPATSTPSSAAISLVASPAPSHTTLIEHPSRSPSVTSASLDMDDLEIVSVSGTMTSYIDAETYTPRTLSPNPSATSSRPISPPAPVSMMASEFTFPSPTPASSMLGSDFTFPVPNAAPERLSPSPVHSASRRSSASHAPTYVTSRGHSSTLSVSSWAAEDDWHTGNGNSTDSEWDAVSDAPSR